MGIIVSERQHKCLDVTGEGWVFSRERNEHLILERESWRIVYQGGNEKDAHYDRWIEGRTPRQPGDKILTHIRFCPWCGERLEEN